MSKQKTTPWFPGYIKPVHGGVYEIQFGPLLMFANWDGKFWWKRSCSPSYAVRREDNDHSNIQEYKWRGLTSPAKDAA